MGIDWNHNGKRDWGDAFTDYCIFESIFDDDDGGDDGGGGCGGCGCLLFSLIILAIICAMFGGN